MVLKYERTAIGYSFLTRFLFGEPLFGARSAFAQHISSNGGIGREGGPRGIRVAEAFLFFFGVLPSRAGIFPISGMSNWTMAGLSGIIVPRAHSLRINRFPVAYLFQMDPLERQLKI